MDWLDREDFFLYFDKNYRPQENWINKSICLDLQFEELCNIIGREPVHDPDDGDQPGPIDRWYGRIDDFLFMVTYYDHPTKNLTILEFGCKYPSVDTPKWEILRNIEKAPSLFSESVTWIGNGNNDGEKALFTKDSNGIISQIYSSNSLSELENLRDFLKKYNNRRIYFVETSEPEDDRWGVFNKLDNSEICSGHGRAHNQQLIKFWGLYDEETCEARPVNQTAKWVLKRLDDNDNTFSIKEYWNKYDAIYEKLYMEAKGHKQTYWIDEKLI